MKHLAFRIGLRSTVLGLAAFAVGAAATAQSSGVLAWGDPGSGMSSPKPLPAGLDYHQVECGKFFTVARRSDGSTVGWGVNVDGECDPPPPPPGRAYVALSAGGMYGGPTPDAQDFAVALLSDGSAIGWGFNGNGQCDVPVPPPGLHYVELSAGGYHALGLLSDGSVLAWGANDNEQCDVPALPAGLTYVEVDAGAYHSIARRSDGSIVAWGDNQVGQCDVPALPAGVRYTHVDSTIVHALALRDDGTGVGWGLNNWGQRDVPNLPPGVRFVQFATGGHFSLGLTSDGSIVAWGANYLGLLNVPAPPPGQVFVEVSAGDSHAAARWGTPAPAPNTYCTGKPNSLGCIPAIGFLGSLTVAGADDFVVTASNLHNQRHGMLFWGRAAAATPFHNGLLCVASPLVRMTLSFSGGGVIGEDCSGSFAQPLTHGYLLERSLGIGTELYAQFWSRDLGAAPFVASLSNALHVVVGP